MITAFSFIIAQGDKIGNKKRAVDNRPAVDIFAVQNRYMPLAFDITLCVSI